MKTALPSLKLTFRYVLAILVPIAVLPNQLISQSPSTPVLVEHLDAKSFETVRLNGNFSLIEFGGKSCLPCRQMQPVLTELKARYGQTVNIYNVYMEDERDLFRQHRITLIPTQVIFDKEGKEIGRHVGFWGQENLLAELCKLRIVQ